MNFSLYFSLIFLGLAYVLSCSAFAKNDENNSKKIIQEYFSQVSQSEFFSAKISHKRFSSLRKKWGSESTGKAEFAQPGLFRWVIEKPFEETTLFDGTKLYQWNSKDKKIQTIEDKNILFSEIKKITQIALSPEKFIENYSLIDQNKISEEEINLNLAPKTDNKEISQINLTLKKIAKQLYVSQLQIHYTNKNIWQIQFSDPSFKLVESSTFQLPKK